MRCRTVVHVVLAVVVSLLAGGSTAASGNGPSEPAIRIWGTTVDTATLERWTNKSGWLADRYREPDELRYARCRRDDVPPRLESRCRRVLRSALADAHAALLLMESAVREARRRGLRSPSMPERVRRFWLRELELHGIDRRRWLAALGATEALRRDVIDRLAPLTDAELERSWRRLRGAQWRTPRQVRAEVAQFATRVDAREALEALRAGASFVEVSARSGARGPAAFHGEVHLFSGPALPGLMDSDRLERVALRGAVGELRGPVAIEGAHYLLRVVEVVDPGGLIPLARARIELVPILQERREERTLDRFWTQVRARWRAHTTCLQRIALPRYCGRVVDRL